MPPFFNNSHSSHTLNARASLHDGTAMYELSSQQQEQPPCLQRDVVLVVDTSSSMQGPANNEAEGLAAKYSKLDIVKHALKVITSSLELGDRVAVVSFASDVEVLLALTSVEDTDATMSAKREADAVIDALHPCGCTSLWEGLRIGLNVATRDRDTKQDTNCVPRQAMLCLLTDGLPQPAMPRGELYELKQHLASHPTAQEVEVHTYGVGYSLESSLLESLSVETGGSYSFIPDGGMVGTVLINSLASKGAASHRDVTLAVQGVRAVDVLGGLRAHDTPTGCAVRVGDVRSGHTRHVLVRVTTGSSVPPKATVTSLDLDTRGEVGVDVADLSWCDDQGKGSEVSAGEDDNAASSKARAEFSRSIHTADAIAQQLARCEFVRLVPEAMLEAQLDREGAKGTLASLVGILKKANASGLLEDVRGQVAEAVATAEAQDRWGKHFVPSLVGAHRDERCNNFKDPGVQAYAEGSFVTLRDGLDKMFCELQPPPASLDRCDTSSGGCGVPMATLVDPSVFASSFNRCSNGCFAPATLIEMGHQDQGREGKGENDPPLPPRAISSLRKGDVVATVTEDGTRSAAKVACVTLHRAGEGEAHLLVQVPGTQLSLTPWHPIHLEGHSGWSFPAWHAPTHRAPPTDGGVVYNLVLDTPGHSIVADGVTACVLGHELTDDVVRHPYFGTSRVVRDLASFEGWDDGLVAVERDMVRRVGETTRDARVSGIERDTDVGTVDESVWSLLLETVVE